MREADPQPVNSQDAGRAQRVERVGNVVGQCYRCE